MRTIIFAFFVMLPGLLLAQSTNKRLTHRVSIGLAVSPTLNYRWLAVGSTERVVVDTRNADEVPRGGYTLGAVVQIPLTDQIALESGLSFSKQGYQTRPIRLPWPDTNPSLPQSSVTRIGYNFLQLPLKIAYTFGGSRWQGTVGIGLLANVFISQQTVVITDLASSSSVKFLGVSRFSLSPVVSVGIQCRLSPTLRLRMEPEFQYNLAPLRPGLVIKEHLYASGLQISLAKRL